MEPKPQVTTLTNLVLVLATAGWMFMSLQGRLGSTRPTAPEISASTRAEPNKVLSRLWQDPFEVFDTNTNAAKAKPPASGIKKPREILKTAKLANPPAGSITNAAKTNDFSKLYQDVRTRGESNKVAILGVMLEGGTYAEDREVRRRIRYATETALLSKGLGPEDRTHITIEKFLLPEGGTNQVTNSIAYEWFRADNSNFLDACVLWLREEDFGKHPLVTMYGVATNIMGDFGNTNISFYLIGPRSSDTLRAMIRDCGQSYFKTNLAKLGASGRFHILSPEVTAPDNALMGLEDSAGNSSNRVMVADAFKGIFGAEVFHNWIATDAELAALIAKELRNRIGVPVQPSSNVVVTITEQDTLFGRTLPKALLHELLVGQPSQPSICGNSSNVWQFSYLRGLDGSKPMQEKTNESPAAASSAESMLESALHRHKLGEKIDGDSQLDYVVRLAETLRIRERKLRHQGRRIIAVGLTGSDAYDKLILIDELRRELPEAVFFTTDLDAELWAPEQIAMTRNMVVASAYPLELENEAEVRSLPFRDVYQTAIHKACQAAIGNRLKGSALGADGALNGGLYALGRSGPIAIGTPEENPELTWRITANIVGGVLLFALAAAMLAYGAYIGWSVKPLSKGTLAIVGGIVVAITISRYLMPSMTELSHGMGSSWLPIGVGMAYGFAGVLFPVWLFGGFRKLFIFREIKEFEKPDQELKTPRIALAVGALFGGFIGFCCWLGKVVSRLPAEETWNSLDGVSIWPCELMRILAILGGLFFLVYASSFHRTHRGQLWLNYFWKGRKGDHTLPGDEEKKQCWEDFWELHSNFKPNLRFWKWRARADQWGKMWDKHFDTSFSPEPPLLISRWNPPVSQKPNQPIDAFHAFRDYVHLGLVRTRPLRFVTLALVYFALASLWVVFPIVDIPTRLCVRGPLSHAIDFWVLLVAVCVFLLVLFYVLDAARLTGRFLDCISRHPTDWPEGILEEQARLTGVNKDDLDGLLDVDFAATKTKEISRLMSAPFFIFLLLLLSRIHVFKDWTWPLSLVTIFAVNFLLAAICWWSVRRAADKVRDLALCRIDRCIAVVQNSCDYWVGSTPRETYLERLKRIKERIETEDRGAYARWFQDPTYFAIFIPTGITGILTVVLQYVMNR